jgi:hypothetical protein
VTGALRAGLALEAAFVAFCGDWVASELFLTRAPLGHVLLVMAAHLLLLAGVAMLVHRVTGASAATALLRAAALFGGVALLALSLRSVLLPGAGLSTAARLAIVAGVTAGVVLLVRRLDDARLDRLMTAIALGSLAFLRVPVAAKKLAPAPREWIAPAAGTPGRATLFLLLDEFAHGASGPLADELRRSGLQVTHDALVPVGRDTQNVVPAMFTGADFSDVRVCGISTMCSHFAVLDVSAIRVDRPDVDIVGQHFPYCDIPGLRSCF